MNMGKFRKILMWAWLVACLWGVALTGCRTMEGAGEDIQGAGRAVERAAE
jgi:predicted small secreted protein